jgi:CubicO group peptidase (beta-lactamase class C family)
MKITSWLPKTIVAAALLAASALAHAEAEKVALPRADPESQGIQAAAIQAFVEAAEAKIDALHSLMVVRHGRVVAEGWWAPYGKDDPHVLYSLSKSFTSTAVGLAIAEGKLSLDDSVLAAFPEDAPAEPSANLKAMRLRDLLTMSTGQHAEDVAAFRFESDDKLTRVFLSLPVAHKPGTHFWYNTPATYMASAMVQKATGQTVLDFLRPRLFDPLGIENPTWEASKQGITLGGFGLRIRTEDIARFGQMLLQKGEWQGRQLVPAAWIAAATARQVSNGSNPASDWEQGYGYQFWRCRHGVYRGDGAYGQFCVVMPEQDTVVAITSGTRDLQGVLNLVWDHILPALQPGARAPDPAADAALRRKLDSLALPTPAGGATSPLAKQVSGKRYVFPANDEKLESVALEVGKDGAWLSVGQDGRTSRIPCENGRWRRGDTLLVNPRWRPGDALVATGVAEKIAGSGAWTADDTFVAKLAAYETPFVMTVAFQFKGDELDVDTEYNVAFAERKRPRLVGKREPK